MSTPDLHLGTVSWDKEDWAGNFYPKDLPKTSRLRHYAERCDTVEVDSTFYRTPSPDLCARWASETPAHFRFSLKVMQKVTHFKVLAGCESEMARFFESVGAMGERFAFALLQFGKFGKKSQCPDAGTFIRRLEAFAPLCPDPSKVVVEVRNADWVGDELLSFLRERRFVFALTEVDGMRKPAEVWGQFGDRLVTSGVLYARIFGERKKMEAMTSTYDRLIVDRAAETRDWTGIFREAASKGAPSWAYVSNYFAGHAPASVDLFKAAWAAGRSA